MSILAWVLKFLGGGVLNKVMDYLSQRSSDGVERDRIVGDVVVEHIKAELATRQLAAEVLKAEQGWWVTAMIRPLFAYPLIIWWAAVIADSVYFHSGSIKALPAPLDEWAGWIVGAYFLTRPFEKTARSWIHRKSK